MPSGILSSKVTTPEEEVVELSLRPKLLANYIGQDKVKSHLQLAMQAARERKQPLDHVLLYGPPGLGKTTLAHIIAEEMQARVRLTSGPALSRAGDLAGLLTSLEPHEVLFIDEIHRLNRQVEELLYGAMEDYSLDLILGKGAGAQSVRMDLPPFTLVGATTMVGSLSGPLRDRFGHIHRLEFYQPTELSMIVTQSAQSLHLSVTSDAATVLGQRSRGTPRIANRLLKRARDIAQVRQADALSADLAEETLRMFEVDELGLDSNDRRYLLLLTKQLNGGPAGVETLAAALAEDVSTLEEVIEPYLLQLGFITRTPRGRMATTHAWKHLGLPEGKQG